MLAKLFSLSLTLLYLSHEDYRHQSIPLHPIILSVVIILLLSDHWLLQGIHACTSFSIPYLCDCIYFFVRKKRGLGLGDSLTLGLIGSATHTWVAYQIFASACCLACLHWLSKAHKETTLAFIPYLTAATGIILLKQAFLP